MTLPGSFYSFGVNRFTVLCNLKLTEHRFKVEKGLIAVALEIKLDAHGFFLTALT